MGMSGQIVSHYRIEEELGRGGMGVVYRARDVRLERTVALKFLASDLTRNADAKARFVREARAASALDHPNICSIHDIDETGDGQLFIAMACYEGLDLRSKLQNEPLSVTEALNITRQIAAGLAAVHKRGIVHRDLKPANVFVMREGPVKIVDFGLAKLASDMRLTRTGVTLGTVNYMSPEQARGDQVDHRSDIWSLGVVLYEMLTGTLPFRGEFTDAVIHAIRHDDPIPPSRINPLLDPQHDHCVMRCLQKKPSLRYQHAEDIIADLDDATVPVVIKRRMWDRWLMGVTLAVLVLAGTVFLMTRHGVGDKVDRSLIQSMLSETRQITTSGTACCPLWSGDGKELIYADDDGLHIIAADGSISRAIPATFGRYPIPWNVTPDGREALIHGVNPETNRFTIWRVPFAGGAPTQLVEDALYGDIGSDGRTLFYVHYLIQQNFNDGIWRYDLATGERHRILTDAGPGTAVYKPQCSPDGKRIAYIRWQGRGHELWICDADGSQDRKVDLGSMHVGGHFCWTRDGHAVTVAGQLSGLWSIWRIPVDGGQLVRLTEASEFTYHASLSPDESALAYTRGRELSRVFIVPTAGDVVSDPLDQSVSVRTATYSADGSGLYYQALVNGSWQVWSAPLAGDDSPRRIVSESDMYCQNPVSGGARHLYYVQSELRPSSVFGDVRWSQQLYRCEIDGSARELVQQAGSHVSRLVGDRRGKRGLLLTLRERGLEEDLHYLSIDGSLHELLRDSDDFTFYGFTWGSRDGEVLVSHLIDEDNTERAAVSSIDITTGERSLLFTIDDLDLPGLKPQGAMNPLAMSDDGRSLFFGIQDSVTEAPCIVRYDCLTREAHQVTMLTKKNELLSLDVSPDGSSAVGSVYRLNSDVFVAEARPADHSPSMISIQAIKH